MIFQLRSILSLLIVLGVFLNAVPSYAVDIQFPEDELARESVYPVFDNPEPVKRRNVILTKHFEVGLYGGWSLNDAIYEPFTGGGMLTYHFSEIHGVQIQGGMFSAQKSQHVAPIEAERDFDLDKAPAPKYMALLNYQITPYYGKISLTKQSVLNLSIFGTAGIGTIAIGDTSYMAFAVGLGQKFYLTDKLGIRADLKAMFHQAPNVLSRPHATGQSQPTTTKKNSEYEKHNVTNGLLTVGVIYLL